MTERGMSDVAVLRGLVAQVRSRLRRARLVRAVGLAVAVCAVAVVVSFALDLALDLPRGVRVVHLAVVLVALALLFRWAFAPLRARPSDERLAEAIEHDVPEFQDRLLSALDFERRVSDPGEPESREMMRAATADAAAVAGRIDPTLLVDGRPARRALALSVVGLLAVLAAETAFPDEFRLWLRRGLLVEDVSWPKRTEILVEGFPEEGPLVVTRGDDLRVVAVAHGAVPDDLVLHLEELEEGESGAVEVAYRDERKMFAIPEQPGRFAFDFRAVAASFRFWVTGGDDVDERPVYAVRALVPPRVASFEATVEPPAYARVPPVRVTDPVFNALRGSKVAFRFTSNMPLASARLVRTGGAAEDLAVGADGLTFAVSFDLSATVEFHLELRAPDGHGNRSDDDVFHVEAVADRPPAVRLLHPRGRLLATPEGIVPVKFEAEDDFGLESATVQAAVESAGSAAPASWSARVWPAAEGPAPAAPERRAHVYRALDLVSFQGDGGTPLKAGDQLACLVRAKDAGGQESEGGEIRVEVVSPEAMAQRMLGELAQRREELSQTRRAQKRAVAGLRELRETLSAAAADAAAVRRARDLQVDQGRVVNDATRFLGGIERVLDVHVLNRMGSVPTVDRLLPLYHEHLALPPNDAGDVFPPALYAKILAEKRANRLYDPELIGILLDVTDLADGVVSTAGPAAYEALDRWTLDDAHPPADLDAAVATAEVLLSGLDAIEERLQKFEDLAQLIQLAKSIREGQDSLTRRLAAPPADGPPDRERDR